MAVLNVYDDVYHAVKEYCLKNNLLMKAWVSNVLREHLARLGYFKQKKKVGVEIVE